MVSQEQGPLLSSYSFTHLNWTFSTNKAQSIPPSARVKELEDTIGIPLPTISFPENALNISFKSDPILSISCYQALCKCAQEEPKATGVAHAKAWQKENGFAAGLVQKVFDWTYFPEYAGELYATPVVVEDTTKETDEMHASTKSPSINYARLADKEEKIVFYERIPIFEDELSDCGVSSMEAMIRVMDWCWYVLVKQNLRVDNVTKRRREVRYYHEFGRSWIIRNVKEFTGNDLLCTVDNVLVCDYQPCKS